MSTDLFDEDKMTTAIADNGALQVHQTTPLALLEAAIANQMPAEQLQVIMGMYERWEDRKAEQAYAEAMTACQKDMPVIDRNAFNEQTKSWYADIAAIHKIIKPIYQRHGFSCSHGTGDSTIPNHYRCLVDVTNGGHTKQYSLDLPADGEGLKGNPNKTPIQAVCSTLAYAQRYLECRVFNITIAAHDRDGNRPKAAVPVISEEQLIQLNELMEYKEVKLDDFLKWAGVEGLNQLPINKFRNAVDMLNRRAKGGK